VQPAGASGRPLLVVCRTDVVRVFTAIPEAEAALVDLGDMVTLDVPALRGAQYEGRVSRTAWALDVANRALETVIDIENKDGKLRPGMYAPARLALAERKDAITLPSAAVVRQGREAFCYLADRGKAVRQPIELGLKVGDDLEVVSGLTGKEMVIMNKAASLKPDQPVEAKPPAGK
jgi:RND family efflux transporter MFP subunit